MVHEALVEAVEGTVRRLRRAMAQRLHRIAHLVKRAAWRVAPTEEACQSDADLTPLWVRTVRSLLDRRADGPVPPVKQELTRADVEAFASWLGEFSQALISSLPDRPAVEGGRAAETPPAEGSRTPG